MKLRVIAVLFTFFLAAPVDGALAENGFGARTECVESLTVDIIITTATKRSDAHKEVPTIIVGSPSPEIVPQLFLESTLPDSRLFIRIRCLRI